MGLPETVLKLNGLQARLFEFRKSSGVSEMAEIDGLVAKINDVLKSLHSVYPNLPKNGDALGEMEDMTLKKVKAMIDPTIQQAHMLAIATKKSAKPNKRPDGVVTWGTPSFAGKARRRPSVKSRGFGAGMANFPPLPEPALGGFGAGMADLPGPALGGFRAGMADIPPIPEPNSGIFGSGMATGTVAHGVLTPRVMLEAAAAATDPAIINRQIERLRADASRAGINIDKELQNAEENKPQDHFLAASYVQAIKALEDRLLNSHMRHAEYNFRAAEM